MALKMNKKDKEFLLMNSKLLFPTPSIAIFQLQLASREI